MKALAGLSLLTLVFTVPSFAQPQESIPFEPAEMIETTTNLEAELKGLSLVIDEYYKDTINLSARLHAQGHKLTSPKNKLSPKLAQEVESLENTRLAISEALKDYRASIDALGALPENSKVFENSKFLFDLALVKAFLPRYEPKPEGATGIVKKLFAPPEPQFAEEILPRTEALNLFYTDFQDSEELNRDVRIAEIVKTHNSITSEYNKNRGSALLQTYPKTIKPNVNESVLYKAIVKGEDINEVSTPVVTCSGLFAL